MLRITVKSSRFYRDQVHAWIRAHGVNVNDCCGIEIELESRLVRFECFLRDVNGNFYVLDNGVDKPVVPSDFLTMRMLLPPAQEWCEAGA